MNDWFEAAGDQRGRLGAAVTPVLERLASAYRRNLLPHGVLLVGPERLGRELAALEAAAMLTCPEHGPPGCTCGSCRRVRRGLHPDVAVVLPEGKAGRIKIEQVRAVVADAPGRPFEAPARVWILDGVEAARFGQEAANAFLKTLEEPPAHVRFLLLAANPESVLPTIRSRCPTLRLPAPMAMGVAVDPPELAELGERAEATGTVVGEVRSALEESLHRRDPVPLLRAARRAASVPAGLAAAALAAGELAAALPERGPALARLAWKLLEAERTAAVLNLPAHRQAAACFLRWYRDEVPG